MIDLDRDESAVSRIEQAKRLIQQARLARMSADQRIQFLQGQINVTQIASGAAADLLHLIDRMSDPDDALIPA